MEPDRAPLTEDFQAIATVELARLQAALDDLNQRHSAAVEAVRAVEIEIARVLRTKTDLEEMLGLSPQLPIGVERRGIGGRELRDVAFDVLVDSRPDGPVHYREWFDLVESRGFQVGGRNPLATFLAQISQDTRVKRVGRKSGLYELVQVRSAA